MPTPVTQAVEDQLRAALPAPAFRDLDLKYREEPRGLFRGGEALVLAPHTTDEVATILRIANDHRVTVVPRAGGTGLVGGQVGEGLERPIILSLERMNRIRSVYPGDNVIVAEAGAILADVQAAAEEANRLFPLSLASEGSACIGGLLGTNAGGVNVLRYGNARELCLGIEAVLPDGSVIHGLRRLRKDNTGYDLRNLLIGSEGTLGVITAASLRLFPRPALEAAAILSVASPTAAIQLLEMAQTQLAEAVSAFELIGRGGPDFLTETMPHVRQPFATAPDWMVLIDIGMAKGANPDTALETLFADATDTGLVNDGVIAQSVAQRAEFWAMREAIPEANRLIGSVSSHDIALPVSTIPEFIKRAGALVASHGDFRINCFGHVGDGNLHYNVFPPKGQRAAAFKAQRDEIKQAVHDLVFELGGSFSAEHGIGRLKVSDLERYGDPARIASMRAIKAALDPNGIMNPGAVLRA